MTQIPFTASAILALATLASCTVALPNGVFVCSSDSECPASFFCWGEAGVCYDLPEPKCAPQDCAAAIAAIGLAEDAIQCGSLPDGCGGETESCGACETGEVCGARGAIFQCVCEENTCLDFVPGGAECGTIPSACGGPEISCEGAGCPGLLTCDADNKCTCPPGLDCDGACGGCPDGTFCDVDLTPPACRCRPTNPCTTNACSPPGGLPDGCGGNVVCPCPDGTECSEADEEFACVDVCSCVGLGYECGNATICGDLTFCGTCQQNGFPTGYRCGAGGVPNVCALPVPPSAPGDILITEVMQNPGGAEPEAEWFELHNPGDRDLELAGCEFEDNTEPPHAIAPATGSLVVSAGGYVVLGRSNNTESNGGVPVDYAYGSPTVLGNSSDFVAITCDGNQIDRVAYDNGATFPDSDGMSMSLSADAFDSVQNDAGSNWCDARSEMASGDHGTPGAPNDGCLGEAASR